MQADRAKIILLLLVVGLITVACGGGSTETTAALEAGCAVEDLELVQEGVLTVATGEPAFPPWVGTTDGENFDVPESATGYESALVYALAEEMGFTADQVTWVRTGFDAAIAPGPKDFDFNIQQYSITDQRDEVVDFSDPYYVTAQALVAFADSPVIEANTVADLKGALLGAQIATTSLDYIENIIQPDTAAAVYDTNVDAKAALDAGQIDALVFDLPTAYFITAVEMTDTAIVGVLEASEAEADEFGMLFAEGNSLVGCVNQALASLQSAGTLDELAATWLTSEGEIKTITR
jgi:polar amino acid transport system substrate-binding protein